MIDVVTLRTAFAEIDGDVVSRSGLLHLTGDPSEPGEGVATFTHVQPTKMTNFIAGEIVGQFAEDSVRVRLSNGIGQFFIDNDEEDGLVIKEVTDTTTWDAEFTEPSLLGNLDLWTQPSLQIIVFMKRTARDRNPRVRSPLILLDHPTWPGAVAQAVRDIVRFVSTVEPVLIHEEVLTEDTSEWEIGEPFSEHGYVLTELVQVAVDGVHKSARLADGKVIVEGPAVRAGSTVEIAVRYRPSTSVRRVGEVLVLDKTPAWHASNLVTAGGLNGIATIVMVAGNEIQERKSELRITVNGVAHRQADALAMRIALERAFGDGLTVTFPDGRCVFAQLDGLVEVVPQGAGNLPMASGVVVLSLSEFVSSRQVRLPRQDGRPVYTSISIELRDGVTIVADITESALSLP